MTETKSESELRGDWIENYSKTESWEREFRDYFDKTLKPKKPIMKNLDRELCIDFIRNLISLQKQKDRESLLEIVKRFERKGTEYPVVCPEGRVGCLVYHYETKMSPEDKKINEVLADLEQAIINL